MVEDLHWLDAPTLGVVVRLIRSASLGRAAAGNFRAGAALPGRVLLGRVLLSARSAELEARPELTEAGAWTPGR